MIPPSFPPPTPPPPPARRTRPVPQVTSFHEKASETVFDINYQRRLTEQFEEMLLPLPAFCDGWPLVDRCTRHWVRHRNEVWDAVENAILSLAVAINLLNMASDEPVCRARFTPARVLIAVLGLALLLAAVANFASWVYVQVTAYKVRDSIGRCSPVPPPPHRPSLTPSPPLPLPDPPPRLPLPDPPPPSPIADPPPIAPPGPPPIAPP